jgi:voltage-gated potassium channel
MKKTIKPYSEGEPLAPWREKLHEIIFEADTPLGKGFDAFLLITITLSVCAVMLDSIASVRQTYGYWLDLAEWGFTLLFLFEYILRLISVRKPLLYAKSFLGIVDLMSILPSFLSLFFAGAETLLVIRVLRVLRVFRVFKLAEYLGEADALVQAMRSSKRKITVFLYTVFIFVVIFGSIMYLVEGEENGFTSIPKAIYWAIITLTTVGYGDVVPQTHIGQIIASAVMIMGYSIIAVPTGIYSAELAKVYRHSHHVTNHACLSCGEDGHDKDADFCKYCGGHLSE